MVVEQDKAARDKQLAIIIGSSISGFFLLVFLAWLWRRNKRPQNMSLLQSIQQNNQQLVTQLRPGIVLR